MRVGSGSRLRLCGEGRHLAVENDGIPGLTASDLRVRKENTAERAAGILRNLIVRGDIVPG
jgi:hypothetical protein